MEDFQTKVLTRLAVIESKIDDVTNIRNKTDEAYHLSKENAEKKISGYQGQLLGR